MVKPHIHDREVKSFASDNYAGYHENILAAIERANGGHQKAYGADDYTERLRQVFKSHFGEQAEVFPVFNGTAANVVGLQSMMPRWGAVICCSSAHINTDEAGAPERVGGIKLLLVDAPDGKLTPELIERQAWGWGDEHRAQPLVVSLTQATELGTVYTPQEIAVITEYAHEKGMLVHMDGARISNAAARLGLALRAFTTDVGVDLLSFGGTKNGILFGEAIVVLNPQASQGIKYLRKFNMQLGSKMRFISAQLIELLTDDLYIKLALHANQMATRLRQGLEEQIQLQNIQGITFLYETQANAVFIGLPDGVADTLREKFHFYSWGSSSNEARWMCSFDTFEQDVDELIEMTIRACT